ncbi:MAG: 2-amino-4-hydroxy-6-hydroxymethyldihydropteridine diphosphokinase [Candidatus Peribacteraceae bacterium]
MKSVYLGLGSNIDAEENLESAADLLRQAWPEIEFSSVYTSAPRHITDQPEFLNAVARFETSLSPEVIRQTLDMIEASLGKNITERFGPRTIDLDLLLFGDDTIHTDTLTVPHPRMKERRFVLEPLSELLDAPWVQENLRTVRSQECEKTDWKL